MKAWIDYDRLNRPGTDGYKVSTILGKLDDIRIRVKFQYEKDQRIMNTNSHSALSNNNSNNEGFLRSTLHREDSSVMLPSYCNLLPNSVFLDSRTDSHFPHFGSLYFKFISFALLAYDSLGDYYELCGYSIQHLLIDEKVSYRFWRAEAIRNQWVYHLVKAVDTHWKADTISPLSCVNSVSRGAIGNNSIPSSSTSSSSTSSSYNTIVHTDWFDSMSWFAHGSDALYLSSIIRHSDPCELLGQGSMLSQKPLNLLILNRRDDRRLMNIDNIVSTVSSVAKELSITIRLLQSSNATTNSYSHNNNNKHHINEFLFEGVSLQQQAETIYSSDIIITTHGAAETNLAWLKPCSIVIEIYGYPFFELYFKGLAEVLNLVHYWWQEPTEHVVPALNRIGSTDCILERIIDHIADDVHNQLQASHISNSNSNKLQNLESKLHITTPNFGQTEYYSSSTSTIEGVDNRTKVDSVITQRCMHDVKCRSCARGNSEIIVTTKYLHSILIKAINDRQQCIKSHPFYMHSS